MVIPNECKCLWCNDIMKRRGITQMGYGLNTFSLWCDKCGAVVIHAKHTNKRIKELHTDIVYQERQGNGNT